MLTYREALRLVRRIDGEPAYTVGCPYCDFRVRAPVPGSAQGLAVALRAEVAQHIRIKHRGSEDE